MAIQKPYNISIKGITIDANESNEVSWKVSGDISNAYKVDIYTTENVLVWSSNKITSFALKHTVPAATLTNGNEYRIKITIYNEANESATSDGDIFQTSSRPVVTLDTIGTVGSFSYNFSATYTQAESVPIRNYVFYLYNDDQERIDFSSIKTTLPIEYLFGGLQSESDYYIEVQATSTKGLIGTTGIVPFSVFYFRPKMNVNLEGKSVENGGLELSWFVTQIIGETDGAPFINNEKIDTSNGKKVWFDEGFDIPGNFSLKLWIENVPSKKNLLKLNGAGSSLVLQYDATLEKFILQKYINGVLKESWHSNDVFGLSFFVLIQQVNNGINLSATSI